MGETVAGAGGGESLDTPGRWKIVFKRVSDRRPG